jgi:pyrroline-5-carboxylate reductase
MKIGFIGAGQMAIAIMKGLLKSKFQQLQIFSTDVVDKSKEMNDLGILWCKSNINVVKKSEIIILCVKPYQIEMVLSEIENYLTNEKLIISIAAV